MKVICIDNKGLENELTLNKIYNIIDVNKCEIIADNRIKWCFDIDRFKPLSEIRNVKINKLLEL
jgi:hypothetical protein